jgi:hypothetical protein
MQGFYYAIFFVNLCPCITADHNLFPSIPSHKFIELSMYCLFYGLHKEPPWKLH